MIITLYKILTTNNPNLFLLKWLIIFAILMIAVIAFKIDDYINIKYEGFDQDMPFVLKTNDDAVDNFYVEIYDRLHDVEPRVNKELINILNTTNPSENTSVFLDVGSGTGNIVNELTEAGYTAYGIENNSKMIDYCNNKFSNLDILKGDVMEPMAFEKGVFTHILCTYFTIYKIEDKYKFFQNCYHWMQPNGYLVIHLVDKEHFEKIIPNNNAMSKRTRTPTKTIVNTKAIFNDYSYNANLEMLNDSVSSSLKETFTDNNNHIRQNEFDLYIEDIDTIVNLAKRYGFIVHAKTNMKSSNNDKNQYFYYFERPL